MTNWYDTIVASLKTAIETVFEQKENKVTSWSSTTTDTHYPSEKLVKTGLDGKVDKESGKGLFSGSYNDLTNKPTIPSAYVHPSEKQCSYAYSHPSEKQCNYSYTHPSAKQCNATIPSASSSIPSADVSGGAIGSSSNYAKADHQHPLSSAYATSEHNHDGTYLKSVTAHTSTTGSDFGQATGAVFGHIKLSNNYTSSAGSAMSGIGASSQAVYNVYNEFSNSSKTTKNGHTHDYAPSSHNQDLSTINNVSTVAVVVTYTDSTTETINLVKYTGS